MPLEAAALASATAAAVCANVVLGPAADDDDGGGGGRDGRDVEGGGVPFVMLASSRTNYRRGMTNDARPTTTICPSFLSLSPV